MRSLGPGTIVYDAEGCSWLYGDPRLTKRLPAAAGVIHRPEILIADLGFIIARTAPRATDIYLRPASVSPVALAGLLYDLKEAAVTRIVLNTAPGEVTIFPSLAAFIGQIDQSIALRRPVRRLERRLATLQRGSMLADLVAGWETDRGPKGLAQTKAEIASRLGDRHLQVGIDATGLHLLVEGLGSGFRVPDPPAFRHWAGQRVSEHPDLEYGRWVAGSFGTALASGMPLAEDIDCDIQWHGVGLRRHVYTRLILPFEARGGRRVVLGTTVTDVDFDLRPASMAATA